MDRNKKACQADGGMSGWDKLRQKVGLSVGDFVLLLCHGNACVIRIVRALILSLGKSSIYSIKTQNA